MLARSIVLGLVLSALAPSPTRAADQVDQQNEGLASAAISASVYAPVGQQFVPSQPRIDWAEFQFWTFWNLAIDPHPSSRLVARVHAWPLTAEPLAVSDTLEVTSSAFREVRHFTFVPEVALVPGQTYVLVVGVIGSNMGLMVLDGDYVAGAGIISGTPSTHDFWFREGTSDPSVAARSTTWGSIKAGYLR